MKLWIELKIILLSEINQTQKVSNAFSLICGKDMKVEGLLIREK
jgi:hypothetical protein